MSWQEHKNNNHIQCQKFWFKLQTTIIVGKVLSEHLFNKTLRFRLHLRGYTLGYTRIWINP